MKLVVACAALLVLLGTAHANNTQTLYATSIAEENGLGWNLPDSASGGGVGCSATRMAWNDATYTNGLCSGNNCKDQWLEALSFDAFSSPAGEEVVDVWVDCRGGTVGGSGTEGFRLVVRHSGNNLLFLTTSWNEGSISCASQDLWRYQNSLVNGTLSSNGLLNDAGVNGLRLWVQRLNNTTRDLYVDAFRIVVHTLQITPAVPGLSLGAVTSSSVNMSWSTAGGGPISGYTIDRSVNGGGYSPYQNINNPATTSFQDNGVVPNTNYAYRISAYNNDRTSATSNVISTRTPKATPSAPSASIGVITANSIDIGWSPGGGGGPVEGYTVEQSINGGGFALFNTYGPGTTGVLVTGLTHDTPYAYRVFASNSDATSAASNTVSGRTLVPHHVAFTSVGSGVAGAVLSPITVDVRDALDNRDLSATNAVTLQINTGPSGAVLAGTLTRNAVGGQASFDDLTLDRAGSAYTLQATSSGLIASTSGTFSVSASITSLVPASGGAGADITVTVHGIGFVNGLVPKLARSGQADIVGTDVAVAPDGRSFSARFDLATAVTGPWDLVVSIPAAPTVSVSSAFTVTTIDAPLLRLTILGPAEIRANRRFDFDLAIENPGNVDAIDVPIWLSGIPLDALVEVGFPLAYPPQAGGEPNWSTVPLTFTSSGGKYLPIVIPRVPPGTIVRRVSLSVATTPTFKLRAAVTPPWADGNVLRACLGSAGISNPACMGAQLTAIHAFLDASPTMQALSGIGVWSKIAWQCEGAASMPAALAKAEQVLDAMAAVVESPATAAGACSYVLPPRWTDSLIVTIVGAVDPSDKYGPPSHAVAHGQAIPYEIHFENAPHPIGTAPAQDVIITDPLDITVLDPTTVSLGDITFGNVRIIVPPGLSSFATTVDMRPARNIFVHVSVGIDPISHALGWSFHSTDPAGYDPPVNDGFLPPNDTPPQGEGRVLFTIMPRASIADGTTIHNHATVKFDDGSPEVTHDAPSTIDTTPPSSHVMTLTTPSNSMSIPVAWTAEGTPNDLRDFTICVSEDNGPFRVWRENVAATSDTLMPPGNHRAHVYRFYSLARDRNGNTEAPPTGVDATTQSLLAIDERPSPFALEGAQPNPAIGAMTIAFTLSGNESAALELLDVAGRRVWVREVGSLGSGNHRVTLDGASLRSGLYFIRLSRPGGELRRRVAVIR